MLVGSGFVSSAPGSAAFEVVGEVISLEGADIPVFGERVSVIGADVGPAVAAVGEGEAAQVVHAVFESVNCPPFRSGEASYELSPGDGLGGNQGRVDASRQCSDTPSGRAGGDAVGNAAEEDAQDLREQQASVDEQAPRVRR